MQDVCPVLPFLNKIAQRSKCNSLPHACLIRHISQDSNEIRFLIVDDDADERFLAERTFKSLSTKYYIQLAASGKESIAYLKGEGKFGDRMKFEFPSYIITDLQME
jgi:hypothetical protein